MIAKFVFVGLTFKPLKVNRNQGGDNSENVNKNFLWNFFLLHGKFSFYGKASPIQLIQSKSKQNNNNYKL